ncbi:hypothetical protein HELRODRAFT_180360 [Helobdella robusta]|uniref:Endonuclease/exonuclease/phosphatase domain-containing protein n=1 Tax=Helobdella robusta TaxID=6412 RepID=T1FFT8_HELRO|nr:hypothetical protein HELRODRAFT_180360 [Helobdella robusta]ESN93951.1 hypothetical protein HELRODRAFT_180360 [Helobdella robusta]
MGKLPRLHNVHFATKLLKMWTLNVLLISVLTTQNYFGKCTLTGRSLEVVEELQRRMVDVAALQEIRWKGEGTRFVGAKGERYKLWWKGDDGTGGVGVMVTIIYINTAYFSGWHKSLVLDQPLDGIDLMIGNINNVMNCTNLDIQQWEKKHEINRSMMITRAQHRKIDEAEKADLKCLPPQIIEETTKSEDENMNRTEKSNCKNFKDKGKENDNNQQKYNKPKDELKDNNEVEVVEHDKLDQTTINDHEPLNL